MIPASDHPAAIRRYASAGFAPQPTLAAAGLLRREALPGGLEVRDGTDADLDLAAEVDRSVRGAAHMEDIGALVRMGGRLLVAERPVGGATLWQARGRPGCSRRPMRGWLRISCGRAWQTPLPRNMWT